MNKIISRVLICIAVIAFATALVLVLYNPPRSIVNQAEQPTENGITDVTNKEFFVKYLDVGQADSALVACNGKYMLIDGGNCSDSDLIVAVLKKHGISHLEYIICTHGHEDHVGGLSGALSNVTVGKVFCSTDSFESEAFDDFKKYTSAQGLDITIPTPGDIFMLDKATAVILGPSQQFSEHNNMSLVVKILYRDTSFLFMGDAELAAEQSLMENGVDLACDVIKIGHHGSSTSTGPSLLLSAKPKYAVISVGKNNSLGHPDKGVLDSLSSAEVTVYRTDIHGDITAFSDGTNITFKTQKNG